MSRTAGGIFSWLGGGARAEAWMGIGERGTFALAAWCKEHGIADPYRHAFDLLAKTFDEEERNAKGERFAESTDLDDVDELRALSRRCAIYEAHTRRLLYEDPPVPARRMLLWALSHLYLSDASDTVVLSRRFLPTDIGVSPKEAEGAYRWLIERGLVERVDESAARPDALVLRLVVDGLNASKQPLPAEEAVVFGFPGARVGGKVTLGNVLLVPLPQTHMRALTL